DQRPFDTENRAHFVAIAARLMRQILVDYARTHAAAKRGADRKVEFDEGLFLAQQPDTNVVALDDALNELASFDEQQSRIVELKYFGGLTNEEIAAFLGISVSTIKREWNVAKAWLSRQIKGVTVEKPESWHKIKEIVGATLEKEASGRSAFLDAACAQNTELRAEVESLLAAYEESDRLTEHPFIHQLSSQAANPQEPKFIGPYMLLR